MTSTDVALVDTAKKLHAMYEHLTPSEKEEVDKLLLGVNTWPENHVSSHEGLPVPFHIGQQFAFDSEQRTIGMIAGTQSGKTVAGPWWLAREIERRGAGDYLAITSSYDLFKLKMLPEMLRVFEGSLGIGRFWKGDKVIELMDPRVKKFWATNTGDPMWGRIILRSAHSLGGLESATAKAAWLDEAGQDGFTIDAWRAIKRRLALNRARALMTTTLYNLGWVKQQIIDRVKSDADCIVENHTLPEGGELEYIVSHKYDTALIQFDSIINPAFPKEEFEEARSLMPADEFAMFYQGKVGRLRHLIYDVFNSDVHSIPRFEVPVHWRRFVGIDFGGANTAALFFAQNPDNNHLYCYREYKGGGKTAVDHVDNLLQGEPSIPLTVGGSKGEGQWRAEFRQAGLAVREPRIKEVNIGIIRTYGMFLKKQIFFFDDLELVYDELGRYQRKKDRYGEILDDIKDKNRFHLMDAMRYLMGGYLMHDRKVTVKFV